MNDIGKARAFYRDTLGLHVEDRPEGLELDVGGGSKVFEYGKRNPGNILSVLQERAD